jgi:hypothetical protein
MGASWSEGVDGVHREQLAADRTRPSVRGNLHAWAGRDPALAGIADVARSLAELFGADVSPLESGGDATVLLVADPRAGGSG